MLGNKTNATYIINKALNLTKPIEEEEIEQYTNRYITNEYTDKETDIVYKMKNKDIYFLIEHQSNVDYSMNFRLEEYKLEIMKSAINKERLKTKEYEVPTVIPIVLYTGKERWTVRRKLSMVQDERLENLNLLQYNLIDISKYAKEDLLKSDKYMDKIFLIEKIIDADEIIEVIGKATKQLSKEEKDDFITIIRANFIQKIEAEKLGRIVKEVKGEDEDMLDCVNILWEHALNKGWEEGMNKGIMEGTKAGKKVGMEEGRKEGRKEGIKEGEKVGVKKGKKERSIEIATNMKKNNLSTELIQKITGLTKRSIEKIKV